MQVESSTLAPPSASRFGLHSIRPTADGKFLVAIVLESADGEVWQSRPRDPTLDVLVTAAQLQSFTAFQRAVLRDRGVWLEGESFCGRGGRLNWQSEVATAFRTFADASTVRPLAPRRS